MLREAARRGAAFADRGFSEAYAALTGQRVPDVLERPPATITRVAFCPSAHLGGFVSYIAYEPDLIVYFSAPHSSTVAGSETRRPRQRPQAIVLRPATRSIS